MFYKKQMSYITEAIIEILRDTKYATGDMQERVALAKNEVLKLQNALDEVQYASDADKYAIRLKAANEEYIRVLRASRKRKAI